jgi:glycosyltransferase involved in cell wall biosynthesis
MHVLGIAQTDVRVMRAATALVKANYTVVVVDVEDEGNRLIEEDIQGVWVKHMIVTRSFLTHRFKQWTLIKAGMLFIRSTLQLLQTSADVYHAHDVSALPACYITACLRRKPLIFEAHEMPLRDRPLSEMGMGRRWLHTLLMILLRYIVPRCAGIITVSPPIVEDIRRRYHVREVTLIRNVPPHQDVAKSDRLRHYLGLNPETRIALYQGTLQPNRGLDRLVRAAAFLERDIVIVFMGKGFGTIVPELEALSAREGVADRVKIIPPVPYTELLEWTASADIGLTIFAANYSPNVRAFLPNKLFEYIMVGLPVLTSSIEPIVDVIRTHDIGRVVSSLAPSEVGEAINRMLADTDTLALMRRNALNVARDELCWEKESYKLIRLYQGVCQRKV